MGVIVHQPDIKIEWPRATLIKLSRSELRVLRLIALGHNSKAVAGMLFLSKRTVDTHLAGAFAKLQVNNRISAIRRAQRYGLLPFEPTG